MEKSIIGVNYKNKRTGEFDGREYTYLCDIPALVGNLVIAPTANGDSVARVATVDIPEGQIAAHILPLLKTITQFADDAEG